MRARLAEGVGLAFALVPVFGEGVATAEPHASTKAAHGAIVVAVSDGAGPPSRALAREVYRDASLRPAIDDATARVLVSDTPPAEREGTAKARLTELAEIRASIPRTGAEVASRRLLASLGEEASAALVIAVSMEGGRPVARVLRVANAAYERIELGATIETAGDGTRSFQWPGATPSLRGLLSPPPEAAKAAPSKPLVSSPALPASGASKEPKSFGASPWFWGALGGVAAVGLTVFVLSRTAGDPGTIHLDGRVVP
jgi:hypothetical protein